ncbi:hypothetical protein [Nocardioides panzhihuensis]|uniref:Uncharacterized protein n=1 Tax=Nocardioides panzhihuensis TaxID=860243 RepID=A0A7Z0IRD7_9ACTN|nr:hypothetical protein [Nocardioides panzhihuensis]NYI76612.1 hypothetical protein [Nocardioides panzhihuensis]
MNTALLVLIVLLTVAAYATFAAIRADRPRATPRSHATDPDFEPVVRWP